MKKWFLIAAVLLLGIYLFRGVGERDIPGRYQAILPQGGTEILELRPNGECLQEIQLQGKNYKALGTWKYNEKRKRICFQKIRTSLNGWNDEVSPDIEQISNASIFTPVSRTLTGKISFPLTEYIDYVKISN